jgi:hypothetical protein
MVMMEKMLRQGDAYADCSPSEEMAKQRITKQASPFRNTRWKMGERHQLAATAATAVTCRHCRNLGCRLLQRGGEPEALE